MIVLKMIIEGKHISSIPIVEDQKNIISSIKASMKKLEEKHLEISGVKVENASYSLDLIDEDCC